MTFRCNVYIFIFAWFLYCCKCLGIIRDVQVNLLVKRRCTYIQEMKGLIYRCFENSWTCGFIENTLRSGVARLCGASRNSSLKSAFPCWKSGQANMRPKRDDGDILRMKIYVRTTFGDCVGVTVRFVLFRTGSGRPYALQIEISLRNFVCLPRTFHIVRRTSSGALLRELIRIAIERERAREGIIPARLTTESRLKSSDALYRL